MALASGEMKNFTYICNYNLANQKITFLKNIHQYEIMAPVGSYESLAAAIYDSDMTQMREIIDAAKTAGVSAIIAADVAAMTYARTVDGDSMKIQTD
jgi:hypothetical protein